MLHGQEQVFFVTTNEKETKYFNVDKNYIPKELIEVVALPTAMEAVSEKKINLNYS